MTPMTPETSVSTLSELIRDYRALELRAHVGLDDVISKVTQEIAEILEASDNNSQSEAAKEAGDTLVNILSASSALGIVSTIPERPATRPTDRDIFIRLGRWNDAIQTLRSRYSRKNPDPATAREATQSLIQAVLAFTDVDTSVEDIVRMNTEKFAKRVEDYRPDIDLNDYIAEYPNFPKDGILFKDVSPMLASPEAMRAVTYELATKCQGADVIAGLDARGFLFGMEVAALLGKPFVMIRKKGKLPGQTIREEYSLEYGTNTIEIQEGSIAAGQKVALIDDLLATGGTMRAAANLVERVGGVVDSVLCVVSLDELFLSGQPARQELAKYRVESVLQYS